jgi:hypothetical protein
MLSLTSIWLDVGPVRKRVGTTVVNSGRKVVGSPSCPVRTTDPSAAHLGTFSLQPWARRDGVQRGETVKSDHARSKDAVYVAGLEKEKSR